MSGERRNIDQGRIDVIGLLLPLLKHWAAILLFAISIGLLAGAYRNFTYKPVYTSSATFVVTQNNMKGSMYSMLNSAASAAEKFKQLINTSLLKKAVAEEMGLSYFPATTNVKLVTDTNLMTLSCTASKAELAYRSLQAIIRNYNKVTDYVIEDVTLEILQPASLPKYPSNIIYARKWCLIGLVAGFIAACLFFIIYEMVRDTVRNQDQVSKKIAARHLGTIYRDPQGSRKGRAKTGDLLISNPLLSFRFVESSKNMAARVKNALDKNNDKILLVTSVAEHEGKSTVAANIALAIAETGANVILIDGDFKRPTLYKMFGFQTDDVFDLPTMLGAKDPQFKVPRVKGTNLFLLGNKQSTSRMDEIMGKGALDALLQTCLSWFDYVIIDSAPIGVVTDTEELAQYADASLLVIRQDVVPVRTINDTIDMLNNTRGKVIGCVLNDAKGYGSSGSSHYGYGYGYGSRGSKYKYGYGYGGRDGEQ